MSVKNKKTIFQKFLNKWHAFNMSGSVKGAIIGFIGVICAALIGGIFLLINTIISPYFSKTALQDKVTMSAVKNTGSVQQQNAEMIINNNVGVPDNNQEFERKLASGLYSYFVSLKDKLSKKQGVDTERIKVYLASNRFFPLDIHVQIGNLLTSIENSNYESATDQVNDIIAKIENRYKIKLSEIQIGDGLPVSADAVTLEQRKS